MAIARDRLYPQLRDPDLCRVTLPMPVLVVHGAGDLLNPVPSAQRLARCLDAQFVPVAGAGHLVEFAQPSVTLHSLLAFRSSG